MTDFPDTRDSLLVQVKDPANRVAWNQFSDMYRPVICRLARRKGLQEADAQDLAQQVLLAVSAAIPRWEKLHEQMRFRHWLRRVTKKAIMNALNRRPRDRASGGTEVVALLDELPAPDPATERLLVEEYRREMYLRASTIVKNDVQRDTWRAFEMTVVEGRSIEATAMALSKSVGTIYASRSRMMRRLRNAVVQLEATVE